MQILSVILDMKIYYRIESDQGGIVLGSVGILGRSIIELKDVVFTRGWYEYHLE